MLSREIVSVKPHGCRWYSLSEAHDLGLFYFQKMTLMERCISLASPGELMSQISRNWDIEEHVYAYLVSELAARPT